jgi:NAD(P)H dehydrogenase (quinone)
LAKVFVVYDTKYGNTKLVAEMIVEGIREVEGIETAIGDVEEVKLGNLADSDVILIGSPNHMGGLLVVLKSLLISLANLT